MKITAFIAGAALAASVPSAMATPDPIVGGTEVPTDNYKFLASLQTSSAFHFCGGSLIQPNVILTAAHCVSNGQTNFRVRLGTTDLNSNRGQLLTPRRVIVHESYNAQNIRNDIALIELTSSVSGISPITRDTSSNTHQGGSATVAGWGRISGGGSSPSRMREVDIPVVSDSTCRQVPLFNTYLTSSMICTGYSDGRRGSCNGDSGGPLFQGSTQIGLVSWGAQGCGSYSVFTQVNSFNSWISTKLSQIGGGSGGGGGSNSCRCIGTGTDVGATCGNWLNAGFNWCYSDSNCPGSTASQRYPGLYWFECTPSRLDVFTQFEEMAVNHPMATVPGSEEFYKVITAGLPTPSGADETPAEEKTPAAAEAPASGSGTELLAGVGIGAAVVGVAAMTIFVVYRKQNEAKVDNAIERIEAERRSVTAQKL